MGMQGPSGKPRPRHSPGPGFNVAGGDPELWEREQAQTEEERELGPGGAFPTPAQGPVRCAQRLRASPAIGAASGLRSWGRSKGRAWREPWRRRGHKSQECCSWAPARHTPCPAPQALLSGGLTPRAVPAQLSKGRKLPEGRAGGGPAGILEVAKLSPTNSSRPPLTRQDHTREVGSGPTGEQALPTSLAPGPGGKGRTGRSWGPRPGPWEVFRNGLSQVPGNWWREHSHPAVWYSRSILGALWLPTEDRVAGGPWAAADSPQDTALPHPLP